MELKSGERIVDGLRMHSTIERKALKWGKLRFWRTTSAFVDTSLFSQIAPDLYKK